MKGTVLFSLTLLLLSALFLSHSFAQDNAQWGLPNDATARFGKGWIAGLQYSPDGTRIAIASAIGIWLYDTETLQEVDLFTGQTAIYSSMTYSPSSIAYSPDGSMLASGGWDRAIRLWDVETGENINTLTEHTDQVTSGDYDAMIRLWDIDTGENIRTLTGHTSIIYDLTFSDEGILASASEDDTVRLWDVEAGESINTLIGHTADVYRVAFSPDGNTVVSSA